MSHTIIKQSETKAPKHLKKAKIIKENIKMIEKIQAYQYKMFAESKRSVLIVLQGLDASGKDGVVKYIFSGMNPLGTRATSFRVPTKEELSHDFLRRIHQQTPAHGTVQIFNRSHYEDILVPTVEKFLDKKTIDKRYDQINDFEKMLEDNGTTIVKFYLNVSKEKQKEKLNERLTDPTKYRKHNIGDWETRDSYDEYMDVYENIFQKCSQPKRHIIAADQNRYKIYQISKILLKVFEDMELKRPNLSPDQETSYRKAKAELAEHQDEKSLAKQKTKEHAEELKQQAKQAKKNKKINDILLAKQTKKQAKTEKKIAKKNVKILAKQLKKDKKSKIKQAKQNIKNNTTGTTTPIQTQKAKVTNKPMVKTTISAPRSINTTKTPIKKTNTTTKKVTVTTSIAKPVLKKVTTTK